MKPKAARAAGLQPKMEEARKYLFEHIDEYLKASDMLKPMGKKLMRSLRHIQIPPQVFAWLWKHRGWPRELIPYPVPLEEEWPRKVWAAIAEWSDLRRMAEAMSRAVGVVVDREEIIRWLYGKEVPEVFRGWIERQAEAGR
ncbi:MAG: hypothetical protein N2557_08045 [Hydrogenophilus sp.]|nr:hypothetical protein [Hydrogenophilus sp.]